MKKPTLIDLDLLGGMGSFPTGINAGITTSHLRQAMAAEQVRKVAQEAERLADAPSQTKLEKRDAGDERK